LSTPATFPVRTDQTPLDEVMLAMDIVDTLRHDRSTVERELDADSRDAALVERIKQIYSGQGIAVTDDLIRKGVEALKQDRFLYVAPRPSFALRMAHVYVERWKWLRRTTITGVLLSGGYAAMQLPQQWQDSRAYAAYSTRIDEVGSRFDSLDTRIESLGRRLDAQSPAAGAATEAVGRLVDEVDSSLKRIRVQRDALGAAASAVDAEAYAEQKQAITTRIDRSMVEIAEVENAVATLEQKMRSADQLRALALRFTASGTALSVTQLEPAVLKPAVQTEVTNLLSQADAAFHAGNAVLAEPLVRRLEQMAAQLTQAYELRIVSQSGVKSGLWRYPVDNPNGKNFYLVVEAIGESGTPLTLPITNEETQKVEEVSRFAVRVPESVYEAVKADKIDNGLVDNALVGSKRRGELDVDFTMPIAGGYITRWED
jgi:hypothetical protein